MTTPATASLQPARDLRIDFFRGCALLIILWNHIYVRTVPTVVIAINPLFWFLFDGADVFVFLSGYVFGLVHDRVQERGGFWLSYRRAIERVWELYAVNLLTFAFVLVVVGVLYNPTVSLKPDMEGPIRGLVTNGPAAMLSMARLQPPVPLFDVLLLYIGILLMAPVLLWLVRRRLAYGVAVSGGLYVLAQLGLGAEWFYSFNVFSWQILFFGGMVVGSRHVRLPEGRRWLWGATLVVVATCAFVRTENIQTHGIGPDIDWIGAIKAVAGKLTLRPVRVLAFAASAYLAARLTRSDAPFWHSRFARPIIVSGQHSLAVFAFGVVVTYAADLLIHRLRLGALGIVGLMVVACALLLGFGYVMEARKSLGKAWAATGRSERLPARTGIRGA